MYALAVPGMTSSAPGNPLAPRRAGFAAQGGLQLQELVLPPQEP